MSLLKTILFCLYFSAGAFSFPMACKHIPISSVDTDQLVQRSLDLLSSSTNDQVFIGIAGGPGSGKSTIAENVCKAINKKQGKEVSIVIPMDGYHYSKKELKRMGELGEIIGDPEDTSGDSTTYDDLMSRRGAPWTFDSKRIYKDLKAAKEKGEGSFPIYSREISDPVEDGASLTRDKQIIFCEGLYLLAFDSPDWAPLKEVWDETWFICVPDDVVKERLVGRHLKNWNESKRERFGEGREGAEAKVESSDWKNMQFVHSKSKSHADLTIDNS